MADFRQSDAGPGELRMVLIIMIPLVVLLLVIGSSTTKHPAQQPAPAEVRPTAPVGQIDYLAHPNEAKVEVMRLAKKSRGDFYKLSYEDQRWLDAMSAGHGADLITLVDKQLKKRALEAQQKTHKKRIGKN